MTKGIDTPGECAVDSCKQTIPVDYLMCGGHWRMVPRHLQDALWQAYYEARRTGGVLGNTAYGKARDACIAAVEHRMRGQGSRQGTAEL